MEAFVSALQHAAEHWQDVLMFLLVSCSAAIFLTGAVKLGILNKVKHKLARKAICFAVGLLLTVGVAALYFVCAGFDWGYYFYSLALVLPFEVVLYALYENTLVRDAVDYIAKKFLAAVLPIIATALEKGEKNNDTKLKLVEAAKKVKNEAAAKVVKTVKDTDLEKL